MSRRRNPSRPDHRGAPTLKVIGITMGVLLLLGVGIAAVVMAILKQQPVEEVASATISLAV